MTTIDKLNENIHDSHRMGEFVLDDYNSTISERVCIYCGASQTLVKHGVRIHFKLQLPCESNTNL